MGTKGRKVQADKAEKAKEPKAKDKTAAPAKANAAAAGNGKVKDKGKPKGKPVDVRRSEPFDQTLPVKLTPAELQQRGQQLGHSLAELTRLEGQLAEAKTANKAAREPVIYERDKLADQLRSGIEYRPVRCARIYDYRTGTAKLVRLDTSAVVEERPLTERERQQALDFEGPDEPLPADPLADQDDPVLANAEPGAVE